MAARGPSGACTGLGAAQGRVFLIDGGSLSRPAYPRCLDLDGSVPEASFRLTLIYATSRTIPWTGKPWSKRNAPWGLPLGGPHRALRGDLRPVPPDPEIACLSMSPATWGSQSKCRSVQLSSYANESSSTWNSMLSHASSSPDGSRRRVARSAPRLRHIGRSRPLSRAVGSATAEQLPAQADCCFPRSASPIDLERGLHLSSFWLSSLEG